MTPKSFFILIFKVLGILSIKELFVSIPQLISSVIYFFQGYSITGGLGMIVISLLTIALYVWISYTLIFKADMLVRRFYLDQHFSEEHFQFNLSTNSILRIAIIVTGAIVLIWEIPNFCGLLYRIIAEKKMAYLPDYSTDWSPLIISIAKVLIALLIIGERQRILAFLERSSASKVENPEDNHPSN